MKTITYLMALACTALTLSTSTFQPSVDHAPNKEKKYLPKELKKVKFGMPKSDLLKMRPDARLEKQEGFREVYLEKIDGPDIASVVFYFDTDGNMPLYEIIVIYQSEAKVKSHAAKLLGPANYKDDEWKLDIKGDHPLHAWIFKNKLVYAMPLPGTEWEGDQL